MTTKKTMAGLAVLGLFIGLSGTVHAQLVQNGDFESLTSGLGQLGFNTDATDWSVPTPPGSYVFVFGPGTADTTGVPGQYGTLGLWGPGNGVANGLPSTSPNGGNFVGMDGDFQQGALSQTINGLTVGQHYTVSFEWAAAQQSAFFGATSDQWLVSLGSSTQSTPVASIPSQGFSGWMPASLTFTATASSEVLSFLASSPSAGQPPFAVLDSVSMNTATVPEPATIFSVLIGIIGFGVFARRRARAAKSVS
jgi:hypothetical protein